MKREAYEAFTKPPFVIDAPREDLEAKPVRSGKPVQIPPVKHTPESMEALIRAVRDETRALIRERGLDNERDL